MTKISDRKASYDDRMRRAIAAYNRELDEYHPGEGVSLPAATEICECLVCGRSHRPLGKPPWALSHDDACRLSRLFNAGANLWNSQDCRINDWLKLVIAASQGKSAPDGMIPVCEELRCDDEAAP